MTGPKRVLSIALLVTGVVLVFAGLTRSVGVSVLGITASLAAVIALLYSGAIWFGGRPADTSVTPETIFVFDRTLRLVSGSTRGVPLTACLPIAWSADLERQCAAALSGRSERISCRAGSHSLQVDAVPVRDADGIVLYGMLILDAAPAERANRAVASV